MPLSLVDSWTKVTPLADTTGDGDTPSDDDGQAVGPETSFAWAEEAVSCPSEAEIPGELPGQRGAETATPPGSTLVPIRGASLGKQAVTVAGGTAAAGGGALGEEGAGLAE